MWPIPLHQVATPLQGTRIQQRRRAVYRRKAIPTITTRRIAIYKIPCGDCDAFYIGQTCRPLTKRIKEHEACHRLNNLVDSATGNIKSAPAKHGLDLGHTIAWSSTSIIASCQHRSLLDLLEHVAISTLEPSMNVQHKGPRVNACWHPLLDTIANSFVSKPANLDIGTWHQCHFWHQCHYRHHCRFWHHCHFWHHF